MSEPKTLHPSALSALKHNQTQLDRHGENVGVSRQALEEMIEVYESLLEAWSAPCYKNHTPNATTIEALLEVREPAWVEFTGAYGQIIRIRNRHIIAIHKNHDMMIKVIGHEYEGPVTYIEYGPQFNDANGTGIYVRGSLDAVQAKLDGRTL